MSKAKVQDPDIAPEYDFTQGKRGVSYERARAGMKVVLVTDEEDRKRAGDREKPSRKR